MANPRPHLSLIIPAYNEGPRARAGFARLSHAAASGVVDLSRTEVLYVNDASTDNTREVLEHLARQLPHARVLTHAHNQGKGAAVRTGVGAAAGSLVVFTDADFAINPVQLPALVDELSRCDLAIGNRAQDGHITYHDRQRTWSGRAFNTLVRGSTGLPFLDTQCGWKGLTTAAARILFSYAIVDRFAFDVDLLLLARALNFSVHEVGVSWDDVAGSSVHVGRDSLVMLSDIARARRATHEMAPLAGLCVPEGTSTRHLLSSARRVGALSAPVVLTRDGREIVLATLEHARGAVPVLANLAAQCEGSTWAGVSADTLRHARSVATLRDLAALRRAHR